MPSFLNTFSTSEQSAPLDLLLRSFPTTGRPGAGAGGDVEGGCYGGDTGYGGVHKEDDREGDDDGGGGGCAQSGFRLHKQQWRSRCTSCTQGVTEIVVFVSVA